MLQSRRRLALHLFRSCADVPLVLLPSVEVLVRASAVVAIEERRQKHTHTQTGVMHANADSSDKAAAKKERERERLLQLGGEAGVQSHKNKTQKRDEKEGSFCSLLPFFFVCLFCVVC